MCVSTAGGRASGGVGEMTPRVGCRPDTVICNSKGQKAGGEKKEGIEERKKEKDRRLRECYLYSGYL